jgi:hypothetical protein
MAQTQDPNSAHANTARKRWAILTGVLAVACLMVVLVLVLTQFAGGS